MIKFKPNLLPVMMLTSCFFVTSNFGQAYKNQTPANHSERLLKAKAAIKKELTYKIIPAIENTWGYDIFIKNKLKIHQPSIPGLPGNKGFIKKSDAEKVARLVMIKIEHNQMPPTISKSEIDSLKIIIPKNEN